MNLTEQECSLGESDPEDRLRFEQLVAASCRRRQRLAGLHVNAQLFQMLGGLMKRIGKQYLLWVFCTFTLASTVSLLRLRSSLAQDQEIRVIELTAKKYEYSPSPFHVKAGAKVQLKITATDHDHGFKIANVPDGSEPNSKPGLVFASPQECWQLKKGETTTIEFYAQAVGTYTFKCCHTCGLGHRGMKGQIVVDPSAI